MDPLEALDKAAARHQDPVLTATVARLNDCYHKFISAVVRKKLAERDAKHETATGLDDAALKEMRDQKVELKMQAAANGGKKVEDC